MDKLTRQGVRNLNDKPKNERRRSIQQDCQHEWRHVSDCTGCWAEQFGGYDHASHTYRCRKCGAMERQEWPEPHWGRFA